MNRRSFFTKLAVGAAAAPQLAKVAAAAPKPTFLVPPFGCTGTWDFAYSEPGSLHWAHTAPPPFDGPLDLAEEMSFREPGTTAPTLTNKPKK